MNKVQNVPKKPGPPVPPRPPASSISARLHSESRVTVQSQPIVAARATTKVVSTKSMGSSAGSPTEAGRTVIYKSPSFDLKKRQNSTDRSHIHQNGDGGDSTISINSSDQQQESPQQQKQHQIFISNQCNNNNNKSDTLENNNVVTIDSRSNCTEIVIINNNDSEENGNDRNAQLGNETKLDTARTTVSRSVSAATTVSANVLTTDFPVTKISPIPKPRTLTLPKHSRSLDNGDVTHVRANAVTINNSNNKDTDNAFAKNIEVENNLKNAAERLFTEIIVNQTQSSNSKTEQYISVGGRYLPPKSLSKSLDSSDILEERSSSPLRSCINLKQRPEPEGGETHPKDSTLPNAKISNQLSEKKVAFHEILISELAAMRKKNLDHDSDDHELTDSSDKAREKSDHNARTERKRYPSGCSTDSSPYGTQRSARIRTSDWVEVGDNGKEVTLTSCHISLEDSGLEDEERLDDTSSGVGDSWDSVKDAEERMSLPDLPPLPKSLSGLELTGVPVHNSTAPNLAAFDTKRNIAPLTTRMTASQAGSNTTSTLDTQLAVLRREMFGLRQLDLSLLSQLWALNESIQDFRVMLQEQETLSPPSPSPSPSEGNSVSSGEEDDMSSMGGGGVGKSPHAGSMHRMRSAPPPPPPARLAPQRPV